MCCTTCSLVLANAKAGSFSLTSCACCCKLVIVAHCLLAARSSAALLSAICCSRCLQSCTCCCKSGLEGLSCLIDFAKVLWVTSSACRATFVAYKHKWPCCEVQDYWTSDPYKRAKVLKRKVDDHRQAAQECLNRSPASRSRHRGNIQEGPGLQKPRGLWPFSTVLSFKNNGQD